MGDKMDQLIQDNTATFDGELWVRAGLVERLVNRIQTLERQASDRSWDIEAYREHQRDSFVADGQWT